VFLFFYGLRSFRSALHPAALDSNKPFAESPRLRNTVFAILALSLLDAHVYLDTVFLVGSIGAHYPPTQRISFALGAILASFIWFFSLAYGAAWLAPLFKRPIAWRVLDSIVGCIMWAIAASLILTALRI
jgi:L-lysine exporter family protein LysE/ArgO